MTVARVGKSLREEAAGVGGVYGESVLPVGFEAAADALVWGLKRVVFTFDWVVFLGFSPGCWRFAPFTRLPGSLRTKGFDPFGCANRSAMDEMNGHSVMRPVPLVERGIGEPGLAGTFQ